MVEEHLSDALIEAGRAILRATDDLNMSAQGAMWVHDYGLGDWRYYLVTSLVDTIGRRKTYRLLLDAFEHTPLPEEMTVEDVHLGSPQDPFFRAISHLIQMPGTSGVARFEGCLVGDQMFDGVLYRAVTEPPAPKEAARIERAFTRRVHELAG